MPLQKKKPRELICFNSTSLKIISKACSWEVQNVTFTLLVYSVEPSCLSACAPPLAVKKSCKIETWQQFVSQQLCKIHRVTKSCQWLGNSTATILSLGLWDACAGLKVPKVTSRYLCGNSELGRHIVSDLAFVNHKVCTYFKIKIHYVVIHMLVCSEWEQYTCK